MKYVCKICGYVYDDDKQSIPFDKLPADWKCPVCGASKNDFIQKVESAQQKVIKPLESIDEDMKKLTIGEFSALCSNLARGCEKQYKQEASALYSVIADYFDKITPPEKTATVDELTRLIANDIDNGYPSIKAVGTENADRGALRVQVWGEKVSNMVSSILSQYEQKGAKLLENTEIWVCSVCGFIYIGDNPPKLCPVCKVPDWKFEKIERRINK